MALFDKFGLAGSSFIDRVLRDLGFTQEFLTLILNMLRLFAVTIAMLAVVGVMITLFLYSQKP